MSDDDMDGPHPHSRTARGGAGQQKGRGPIGIVKKYRPRAGGLTAPAYYRVKSEEMRECANRVSDAEVRSRFMSLAEEYEKLRVAAAKNQREP